MATRKTIVIENITRKTRKGGSQPEQITGKHAEIVPGESIRIYGTETNRTAGPATFDKTFRVGDRAEYDSYNLKYVGEIIRIGPKTVTIKHYAHSDRVSQLDLHTFIWRNWDFDAEKIAKYNAEESMCI